jgi:Flp pilus assembly pilin Flp
MNEFRRTLARFLSKEQGTETLEWGLLCGMIIAGAVAAATLIGPKITKLWNDLNSSLPSQ